MFILALFCLLAVGSQAKPLQPVVEPAQHIVIVTPQAQVHLEPAVRYVHGLSPLARVSGPHHEETIVYVPAGAAASVVPNVPVDTVGSGRARGAYQGPEGKQAEQIPASINEIQQQATQQIQVISGQFGEAASAAAAAGAGFFPNLFPNNAKDDQQQKSEKIELIETPANTQPLLAAAEARHFYSLPQVYHTPVVDVVHTPVYTFPLSAIRARSIQAEDAPIQAIEAKPVEEAAPAAAKPAEAIAAELPEALPLLKEQQIQPETAEQPIEQAAKIIIPAAAESSEAKPEIAARQLEDNIASIKQEEKEAIPEQAAAEETKQPILKEAIPAEAKLKELKEQPEQKIEEQPQAQALTSQPEEQQQQQQQIKAIPAAEAIAEPQAQAQALISQPEAQPANESAIKETAEAQQA